MEKVKFRTFKGIEFIRLAELPEEQHQEILNWIEKENIISIMIGNDILKDCVQYSDYCFWYDNFYQSNVSQNTTQNQAPNGKSFGLAFD